VKSYCVHPPDLLGAEVDHLLAVVICIHEFTPFGSRRTIP